MELTDAQAQEIAEELAGTCESGSDVAKRYGVDEATILQACADNEVERCAGCGWWFRTGEENGEEKDGESYCEDCSPLL